MARIWASQLSESLQKTQSDGLESGLALSYQSSSNPGLWQATTLCLSLFYVSLRFMDAGSSN